MLDIGTTTLQVARHLRGRERHASSPPTSPSLDELRADPDVELVLPGGLVRRNYLSTGRRARGGLAAPAQRRHRLPRHQRGRPGPLGVWDTTMVEVPIKRAMIARRRPRRPARRPREVRHERRRPHLRPRVDLDQIVTDADLPGGDRAAIEDAGIEVTIA